MLSVALARSFSDGVALCTSGFVDDVMFSYHEAIGPNQARRYVYKEFASSIASIVPVGRQMYGVWSSSSECGTGAKSAVLLTLEMSLGK